MLCVCGGGEGGHMGWELGEKRKDHVCVWGGGDMG